MRDAFYLSLTSRGWCSNRNLKLCLCFFFFSCRFQPVCFLSVWLLLNSFYQRIWSVLVSVSFCWLFYCCANKLDNRQLSFTLHHQSVCSKQSVWNLTHEHFGQILNQTVVWCILFIRPHSSPSATQAIVWGEKG